MVRNNMSCEDLILGREVTVEIADAVEAEDSTFIFAVCIETDNGKSLVPMKIYQVKPRGERVLVVDEEGEPTVYPASFFMPLKLAPALESALTQVKQ
jgi:hypothetical protein